MTDETETCGKATNASGAVVLRFLLLINGGAAVAILAFLGALVSRNSSRSIGLEEAVEFCWPLIAFASGVALAVASALLTCSGNLMGYMSDDFVNKNQIFIMKNLCRGEIYFL